MANQIAESLLAAGKELNQSLRNLHFGEPVACIYNPLEYAWAPYCDYVRKYALSRKRAVFLGMNPGPFGMVQTGIPFGEVSSVRDWLGIRGVVNPPERVHPKRPVLGFACSRAEVSGKRLWKLFADRFCRPEIFFREHFVLNYCPLAFMESSGRNRTPDKLPASERERLFKFCDAHLREVVSSLKPDRLIAIGRFAFDRASDVFQSASRPKIGQVLHPSPACPSSNRNWAGTATAQLQKLGVWEKT